MNAHLHGAAQGLVLGEALSWTGMYQRSYLLPFWTRRKRREIESQYENDALIELSLPFALNQPTDTFTPGPGLHAEWFAFQLEILQRNDERYSSAVALDAWRELLEQRDSLRLTISQHATLENLARGKRPPVTGYDNPHYFDDGACFRALPLAVLLSHDSVGLTACVTEDAVISHTQDGVWAAQAYAAAVAGVIETGDVKASLEQALTHLPEDSWIGRLTRLALSASESVETLLELIHLLSKNIVNPAYNYGNSAAETVPITFAILNFTQGDMHQSLFAALALPRTAGSVAPLVGALCGVLNPEAAATSAVFGTKLAGISLPMFKDVDLIDLLDMKAVKP
ncbi:ADP-ribosylglycohydrolase family protein [soil metagenome]